MLKKKLDTTITPFSRFLFRRRGRPPPPIPSTYISTKPNPISQSSSPRLSFSRTEIYLGYSGQKSNLFCSGSCFIGKLRCWNCNSEPPQIKTPFLVCESCRSVQPVNHSIDYFQILGLEKNYDIGGENLEGKYKDWQKKIHPDLVHAKSQKEREYAAEQSARVNDAYRTLTDPLSRAKYILKLQGVELDEEERITDPELLAEIMEIREAVEEAAEALALNQIQGQIRGKLEDWSKSFADALKSKEYDEAKDSIRRMTYYKRAIEEITKKL